jgi:hypothetical protein
LAPKEIYVLKQMSTGDQTAYVRSKIAERGSQRGAKFMVDGFDRWAESEAPARVGQEEKIPAETQMDNYGGAMSLKKAKRLAMIADFGMDMGKKMTGGASLDEAKAMVSKLLNAYRGVSAWVDDFLLDLQDNVIDNPKAPSTYVKTATELKAQLEKFKVYKDILDGVASAAASVGLGKKRRGGMKTVYQDGYEMAIPEAGIDYDVGSGRKRRGGAFDMGKIGEYIALITKWYNWFKDNAKGVRLILGLRSLNVGPGYGNKLLALIDPILSKVGLGRRGKSCCCESDEEEYSGGADFTVQQVRTVGGRKRRGGASSEVAPMYKGGAESMVRIGGPSDRYIKGREPAGMRIGGAELFEAFTKKKGGAERIGAERVYGMGPSGGRKPSARGAIVRKVMQEQGLSLPQASKYVKEQGLY